jgi:uncharacterized protein (TIGR03435 family)
MSTMFKSAVLIGLAAIRGLLFAQPTVASPAFEVASVKEAAPFTVQDLKAGRVAMGMRVLGDRVEIRRISLERLIALAYGVEQYQVSGPGWMSARFFEVMAKVPAGASRSEVPAMIRTLLSDRFGLVAHHGTKEIPVYALIVGKEGPRLKEAAAGAAGEVKPPKGAVGLEHYSGETRMTTFGDNHNGTVIVSDPSDGDARLAIRDGTTHLTAPAMTMVALAKGITPVLDRPVVDMTHLGGRYELELDVSGSPEIFRSIEKLGLKLERQKAAVEFIIVDRLRQTPTEN